MADIDRTKSVPEILAANKWGTATDVIDQVFQTTPVGALSTAIGDSFYGINHRQTPNAIQINKDFFGLTFFTRPRLNLTTENIRAVRKLAPLLNTESASVQRIIRCLLSPDLQKPPEGRPEITSPFVDPQQAFIPILSNHLISMSGWTDVIAPFMTSQEGVYKEAFSYVDGVTDNYSTYDITANFRNIPGDPITLLFLIWVHYASLVYQGVLVPFPDMIIENEVDYQTRIYRLVLDSTKTRVQKIAACGAAFPWSAPIGSAFDFESDRPINNAKDQISVPFRCMGAMYQDDILIYEFNETVGLFNQTMGRKMFSQMYGQDTNGKVTTYYTNPFNRKIPMEALGLFNNRGYPRINMDTYELEWWVSNEDYAAVLPGSSSNQII